MQEEQERILKKGKNYWNEWRKNNPKIIPQLAGFKLMGLNLSGYNFYKVNFKDTTFYGSDLTNCNFKDAICVNTEFSSAILTKALFMETVIIGCDFKLATFKETIFLDCLMENNSNLGKGIHKGRSFIDGKTFKLSPDLPMSFLKGCGLADWEYEIYKLYDPNLSKNDGVHKSNLIYDLKHVEAEQFQSCFISYAHEDEVFASKLYMDLTKHGIACWYAPKNMVLGQDLYDSIDEAIEQYSRLIVILSSFSTNSSWVEDEIKKAFAKERVSGEKIIIPIVISEQLNRKAWVKKVLDNRHYANLLNWRNETLYKDWLKKLIHKSIIKNDPTKSKEEN